MGLFIAFLGHCSALYSAGSFFNLLSKFPKKKKMKDCFYILINFNSQQSVLKMLFQSMCIVYCHMACLRRGIVTLIACACFFAAACFDMSPQIACLIRCIVTLVAFVHHDVLFLFSDLFGKIILNIYYSA